MPEIADWYRRKSEAQSQRDWPSFRNPPDFASRFPALFRKGIPDPHFAMLPPPELAYMQSPLCGSRAPLRGDGEDDGNSAFRRGPWSSAAAPTPAPAPLPGAPAECPLLLLLRSFPEKTVWADLHALEGRATVVTLEALSPAQQGALARLTPDVFALPHFLDLRQTAGFLRWLIRTRGICRAMAVVHSGDNTWAGDVLASAVLEPDPDPDPDPQPPPAQVVLAWVADATARCEWVPLPKLAAAGASHSLQALGGALALASGGVSVVRCPTLDAALRAAPVAPPVEATAAGSPGSSVPTRVSCAAHSQAAWQLVRESRAANTRHLRAALQARNSAMHMSTLLRLALGAQDAWQLTADHAAGWPQVGISLAHVQALTTSGGELQAHLGLTWDPEAAADVCRRQAPPYRVFLQLTRDGRGLFERRWEMGDDADVFWYAQCRGGRRTGRMGGAACSRVADMNGLKDHALIHST